MNRSDVVGRATILLVVAVLLLVVMVAPALAQPKDPYGGGGPGVAPTSITEEDPSEVSDVSADTSDVGGTALPVTGTDLALIAMTGSAAIATGTLLIRRSRRRDRG